jgi:L-fuconolactonase
MVTDTHVHLWNKETEETPWRQGWKSRAHGSGPFAATEAISAMAEAGVDRLFAVPASWDVKGNELVLQCAKNYPEKFKAICVLSLQRPEARDALARYVTDGASGIRQVFPPGMSTSWLSDGTADWLWPELEKLDVPLMIWAPAEADAIVKIASTHPGLRVAIDHINLDVHSSLEAATNAVRDLSRLSELPNVYIKLSALPCYATDNYPFTSVHDLVRRCVDTFGTRRLMWGTDLSRLPCSYREAVASVTEHMTFLDSAQLADLMDTTAIRWLEGSE